MKNIELYRRKNDMRQEDLANKLGVSVPAVCQWETGINNPREYRLEQMANLFNCSVDDLRGDVQ